MEFRSGAGALLARWNVLFTCLLGLVACGGGDGGAAAVAPGNVPVWTQNVYAASSAYANQCATPRTGANPSTNAAYTDRAGSILLENIWLRSYMHELYFWYADVADANPANFSTTTAYFDNRRSPVVLSSGKRKDQFSFTMPTSEWVALSQSGVSAGYGVEWVVVSATVPRLVRAAYVEPNSPAADAGITRGDTVLSVDGVSVNTNDQAQLNVLNAGLWPAVAGQPHSIQLQTVNSLSRPVSMLSANVTSTPVLQVQILAGGVGYILFNSHVATAEQQLLTAFTQLRNNNVTDLVLDLRYNGGGFLAIASEVAYMIAGSTATSGKLFERIVFNNQYASNINPVTGGSNAPTPFLSTSSSGAALPTLNLSRVFVVTSDATCSASESIINGLRGIGVQVIQIGGTTCGKPYGFYPKDNCGTTYFPIEFQGVNYAGFGDYPDGFAPNNSSSLLGYKIPGCAVADDFTQLLGNTSENGLEAALYYRNANACSPLIRVADRPQIQQIQGLESLPLEAPRKPWENSRILSEFVP